MTTEQKALALANEARQFCTRITIGDEIARRMADELERAIEREQAAVEAREADKKAFSDAVKRFFEINMMPDSYRDCLFPFILPEPEPLVEALANVPDEDIRSIADSKDVAVCRSRIADALRGYKIERIDND